ncbi:MAG TPA: BTAD domain-containing putative transcriptional regulator [Chloroflexaceae bacterium]|nr:BTAD domain-containing putative transcriptional regulator [Chloroflexaceae bacterium]
MAELKLFLFGAPRIERDGQRVSLRRTRALALLAYLATTGQPQERARLLALLWPEFDGASARNNLRRELSLLRAALGEDVLRVDRLQVAWSATAGAWVDVAAFHALLAGADLGSPADLSESAAADLARAAGIAADDFLAGFSLPDCPDFEEWQFFQREGLRRQLAQALRALVAWHERRGAYEPAIDYARRWLANDPLHEPAQRELMRLYALSGQYAAALRQYDECVRLLEAELGAAPEVETQALAALVRARRLGPAHAGPQPARAGAETPPSAELTSPTAAWRGPLALPPFGAGVVGRAQEVADIVRRLTDPDCRLLTLAGPGGVGKTQLALRVAHALRDELAGDELFADGVAFVPLLAVATPDGVVGALAAALQLEFEPGVPSHEQLFAHLGGRRMLLVLDNLEHLDDVAPLLTDLLAAAQGVRLLATSRVALNLPEEWFHPVDGLATPPADAHEVAQLGRYDAVRLFEQLGRRARGDFRLSAELGPVVRLCRLVEGMPLALELAAGWLKTLTVEQVVAAIEGDPEALSSRDRTVPDRHRSLGAIFAETWRRLAPDERAALVGLSVFVGEFAPEAALAVSGAGIEVLAGLVEQSLVRSTAHGRLLLHELLRHFAARQLPEAARAAAERHCAYYLTRLSERETALMGRGQQAALAELGADGANLRAAWLAAVAQGRLDLLDRALASLAAVYAARTDAHEGEALLARAAVVAEAAGAGERARRVAARALIRQAAFLHQLGDSPGATGCARRGLGLAAGLGLAPDEAEAHIIFGQIAGWAGDEVAARRELELGLRTARSAGAGHLVIQALPHLAWLHSSYGDFVGGRRLAAESLEQCRQLGRPDLIARALRMLGWAAAWCGDYASAELHLRESLEISERLGHRHGVAAALNGLGWAVWCRGDRPDEASALHERALAILRAMGNGVWISNVLGDLALVALSAGELARARALSEEGLGLARRHDSRMYRAYHLGILGHLAAIEGQHAQARSRLREALECALAARLWPKVAFVLYQVALLRLAEAEAGVDEDGFGEALRLLAAVAAHPATWHIYRARAERRLGELRARLPAALAADAAARGQGLDWGVDLHQLMAALSQVARQPPLGPGG